MSEEQVKPDWLKDKELHLEAEVKLKLVPDRGLMSEVRAELSLLRVKEHRFEAEVKDESSEVRRQV